VDATSTFSIVLGEQGLDGIRGGAKTVELNGLDEEHHKDGDTHKELDREDHLQEVQSVKSNMLDIGLPQTKQRQVRCQPKGDCCQRCLADPLCSSVELKVACKVGR